MSKKFLIRGGNLLSGTIDVRGSKNAALPILAATILTSERCRIGNLPLVLDVYQFINILEKMGSSVQWTGKRSVDIVNRDIDPDRLDSESVKKMRASILLLGPLLARFGKVKKMHYPGGCSIGSRPIDTHLEAFKDLGARVITGKESFSVEIPRSIKSPSAVTLNEFSVTATENMLMFLSCFPVDSSIKIAACEPHVEDLAKFLSKMGAKIRGAGTNTVKVRGTAALAGAACNVVSDYIEAGTFIIAALSAGGDVRIRNVPVSHLEFVIKKLISAGANIKISNKRNVVEVFSGSPGAGADGKRMNIVSVQCLPHPGIPTDLQSAFAVFATQTKGATLIHEPLYEKRFNCLSELSKMGAKTKIYDPHRAVVWGPSTLRGANVKSRDLRGGAALVIAGLAARGTTTVSDIEHVERGYEDLEGRLRALGADIEKI